MTRRNRVFTATMQDLKAAPGVHTNFRAHSTRQNRRRRATTLDFQARRTSPTGIHETNWTSPLPDPITYADELQPHCTGIRYRNVRAGGVPARSTRLCHESRPDRESSCLML